MSRAPHPMTDTNQRALPDDKRVELQHGERCCEGTRRPIWLFQERRYHVLWWEMEKREDAAYDEDLGWYRKGTDNSFTVDEMVDMECAVEWWDTVTVFLSREEGEDFGSRKAHHFTDGWRVYCRGLGDYNSLADYLDQQATLSPSGEATAGEVVPGVFVCWEGKHAGKVSHIIPQDMLGVAVPERHNGKHLFYIGLESVERLYTAAEVHSARREGVVATLEVMNNCHENYRDKVLQGIKNASDYFKRTTGHFDRKDAATSYENFGKTIEAEPLRAPDPDTILATIETTEN